MASQLFANNASATLATPLSSGGLSLTVSSGQGALFPTPAGGDWFALTLQSSTAREIVTVTARSSDTMTIVRAQEGTSASSFAAGDTAKLLLTAAGLNTFVQEGEADAVTYAMLQNVSATDKVLGRSTSGSGNVEEIVCTAAGRALIDDASASDQRTTLSVYSTSQVDTAISTAVNGLSWKQAVRAATTAPGTLASSFENGDTIDGVTLATGNRILIKDQAAPADNGIYVVAASGAPTRATDADSGAELVNASVYVSEGTVNADTQWTCTTNATITVNSTSLAFAQLTSGGVTTLAALTDVDVPSPSDGDVLTYSTGSSKWEAAAPAVSGGGNYYDPMALRAGQSASALDDDWSNTGTTLNARWTGNANWPPTAFNIDTTKPRHLYVRHAGNSTAIAAILQAIPAGDFVIQTILTVGPNENNLSHAELLLTDGTGGSANLDIAANYQSGLSNGSCYAIQSGTAANITGNIRSPIVVGLNPLVVRIERASGSYTVEFSADGIAGYRFPLTPGFTPTHFGIAGAPFSGELRYVAYTFRYDTVATTRWGAYV